MFLQAEGDLDLKVLDGSGVELARSVGLGDREEVSIPPRGAPWDVVIHVENYTQRGTSYTLNITAVMPAPEDNCASAVTLVSGQRVTGSNVGANNGVDLQPAASCVPYGNSGGDLFYRVSVPAGQTLTATTSGDGETDVVLLLLDGCAGNCCLAGADAADLLETLRYTNATGALQDLILVVDGYRSEDVGAFTLDVTVQ